MLDRSSLTPRIWVHRWVGFEEHRHAVGLHELFEMVGHLLAYALLNGEPPGEQSHQPGQLGDPDDLLVGDVADMGHSVKRERMVLAQREEGDGSLDDLADPAIGAAAALGREGREQLVIALVPRRGVEQSKQEPPRGVPGAGVSRSMPRAWKISAT